MRKRTLGHCLGMPQLRVCDIPCFLPVLSMFTGLSSLSWPLADAQQVRSDAGVSYELLSGTHHRLENLHLTMDIGPSIWCRCLGPLHAWGICYHHTLSLSSWLMADIIVASLWHVSHAPSNMDNLSGSIEVLSLLITSAFMSLWNGIFCMLSCVAL